MARLLTCGWETGDLNEFGVLSGSAIQSVVGATPTPRAGNYVFKVAASGLSIVSSYRTVPFALAKTEVWVRLAFYCHSTSAGDEVTFLTLFDALGATQANVSYTTTDGLLRLYRGAGIALLATASTAFAIDGWHLIEVRQQMTSTTVGVSEVWLDGNRVINFSGDNTQTTTVNVQSLAIGQTALTATSLGTGSYLAFDDLAVNDTAGSLNNGQIGDGRVLLLVPNGAGSSTQLVRGGTDTGANWSQVSELPPSMGQYVGSATIGQRDLYAVADLAGGVSSINVVEALVFGQNSDAGGGYVAPTLKSGATTNEVTPLPLSTSPNYVTGRWETDPNTTAAWTQSGINALEAGVTIR